MKWMIKDSAGAPNAALTLLVISFAICCISAVVGMVEAIEVGTVNLAFNPFDPAFAMAVFAPLCGLYWGRRYTSGATSLNSTQEIFANKQTAEKPVESKEEPNKDDSKNSENQSEGA